MKTDKITTSEAIKRLKKITTCTKSINTCLLNHVYECGICESNISDKESIEAFDMAIEALEYKERDREMKSAIHCYDCCGYKEWKNDR